jgi:hypothetical protein
VSPRTVSSARRRRSQPSLTRKLKITDVQWVLGHAHITTTEIYTAPTAEEVVPQVLAHHARQSAQAALPPAAAPGYRPEVLQTLFGAVPLGGDPA